MAILLYDFTRSQIDSKKRGSIFSASASFLAMDMRAYYAVFVPEEDGKISVWFPDVPGCQDLGRE